MQTRECDHPMPAHGGTFCIGERARFKTCNIETCSDGRISFRAEQCMNKNKKPFKGKFYSWYPFVDVHAPCKLYCSDKEESLIHDFDTVEDGTSCNLGKNDMCISGICRVWNRKNDYKIQLKSQQDNFSFHRESDATGLSIQMPQKTNAEFAAVTEVHVRQSARISLRKSTCLKDITRLLWFHQDHVTF